MSGEGGSQADRDLLARLNALKKTHIDLDDKQYRIPVTAHILPSIDPTPAKSLHEDLLSRFKTLNGTKSRDEDGNLQNQTSKEDPLAEEDGKTIEELLAELGGEGAWNIEKDEATEIDDLLKSANTALKDANAKEVVDEDDDRRPGNTFDHELPSIDIEVVSNPHADMEDDQASDDNTPHKSKQEVEAEINREADDIIARLKDQLKNTPPEDSEPSDNEEHQEGPPPSYTESQSTLPSAPAFDLPTTPSKDPSIEPQSTAATAADNDLASRFASLGLPSTPTTSLPSAPSTKPTTLTSSSTRFGASGSSNTGHTAEEIDSWCIICCEDATLRCLGCDEDLYCAKCWIEGHKGPDAGYEERKHRAVEYNRGVKKVPRRRVAA